jgi:hypothetical protein
MFGAPFPNGQTITVWKPGPGSTVDRYNNAVAGAETSTDVEGCAIAYDPGLEDHSRGRDAAVAAATVYAPAGTDVDAGDEVELDGVRWQVSEPPAVWQSPFTGSTPGVAIRIRKVQG